MFLNWLDPDRETAGHKYEHLRRRLIRILVCRGCQDAETLADVTIDRVVRKLPSIIATYVGDPAIYCFGVANKVHLEWLRKQKRFEGIELPVLQNKTEDDSADLSFRCLENCLGRIDSGQRDLIVRYYVNEKSSRIRDRKELIRELGVSKTALHIRISRLRAVLRKCIRECLDGASS